MVIKELASDSEDNNKTLVALASCRPTCHVLSSLAMPFIFSSIQLTDDLDNSATLENRLAACRILKKNGQKKSNQILTHDVAASVQTFSLCCHKNEPREFDKRHPYFCQPSSSSKYSKILLQKPRKLTMRQGIFSWPFKPYADLQISRPCILKMLMIFLSRPSLHVPTCDLFVFMI